MGSEDFCISFMDRCADGWVKNLNSLASMAVTQPQASYAAFTKGLSSKWLYHIRCSQCPPAALECLDAQIDEQLLPSFIGGGVKRHGPERELLSFPTRFGGLAVPVLAKEGPAEFAASLNVTKPLVELLLTGSYHGSSSKADDPSEVAMAPSAFQSASNPLPQPDLSLDESPIPSIPSTQLGMGGQSQPDTPTVNRPGSLPPSQRDSWDDSMARAAVADVRHCARAVRIERLRHIAQRQQEIRDDLSPGQQFLLEIAAEKGVSSWLTVSPCWKDGTVMSKSDFRDAVCIRYDRRLPDLPKECVCGEELTTRHAFTCSTGGYPIARHNDVRDMIAGLIREAGVVDVEIEPKLLPCEGSDIPGGRSLNMQDEARLDVRARGFWSRLQDAYFDVRITHPAASVRSRSEALSQLRAHERVKKNTYGSRVINVQRGSFTPLVFSTYGLCGPETTIFLKSLASLFVERNRDLPYSAVMGILRTRLSFCLLRWCITCFRGCRSSYTKRRFTSSLVSQCRRS